MDTSDLRSLIDLVESAMTGNGTPPALLEGDVIPFPVNRRVNPQEVDFETVRPWFEHACRTDQIEDWKACGVKLADLMPRPGMTSGRGWGDFREDSFALVSRAWDALDLEARGGHFDAKRLVAGAVDDRWWQGEQFGQDFLRNRTAPELQEAEQPLAEEAPPGMEEWITHRKPDFKDRYGDRWEEVLYATAWRRYRAKKRKKSKKKS